MRAFVLIVMCALSSCTAPWFDSSPGARGAGGMRNKWVDILAGKIDLHAYGPVNHPGNVGAANGAGRWYYIDFTCRVSLKRKTESGQQYRGYVTDPFLVQAFVRTPPGGPAERTDSGDQVAYVLLEELPPLTLFDDRQVLPPTTPGPAGAAGTFFEVTPPLLRLETREFHFRGYFFSFLPVGTELGLVVRADIRNDIHPEKDGYDSPSSPGYKAPDFDGVQNATAVTPVVKTNNEAVKVFQLR